MDWIVGCLMIGRGCLKIGLLVGLTPSPNKACVTPWGVPIYPTTGVEYHERRQGERRQGERLAAFKPGQCTGLSILSTGTVHVWVRRWRICGDS